jgi:ankyrin repeat protein
MRLYFRIAVYLFAMLAVSVAKAGSYEDYFRAIEVDNDRGLTRLFAEGFDPNTLDPRGQPGILLAMKGQSYKAAQVLFAQPALKVDEANPVGETALLMAAMRGSVDWCQRLLDRGAQLNRPGWSALHYAATSTEPKVITMLLDRGAAIDAQAANGATPLMMAASYGSEDVVALLLARGANPKLLDKRGVDAVGHARASGREPLAKRIEQALR